MLANSEPGEFDKCALNNLYYPWNNCEDSSGGYF